jgi:carbonic anhydrase
MKPTSRSLAATLTAFLLWLPPGIHAGPSGHGEPATAVSAADSLARLKAGNRRFVANRLRHPRQTAGRRAELATHQHPFAVVLGCSDSRTPPEVIFDQGLGDLFVVRVAGNVVNDETLGSIEYAVEHLGAKLIVVLGHKRCGAVKAAREAVAARAPAPGHLQSLVEAIRPAVEATAGADVEATVKVNVRNVAQAIRDSAPVLKPLVAAHTVAVVGAYYDLDTGVVTFAERAAH